MRTNKYMTAGFTLVELMVVVGIIGLLAAVAIPSFKRYQAKSKSAEAPLNLSAVYTGEKALFGQFGTYVACIKMVGFAKAPAAYYVTGFSQGLNSVGKDAPGTACPGGSTAIPLPTTGKADWTNTQAEIQDQDAFVVPDILKVMGGVNMSSLVPSTLAAYDFLENDADAALAATQYTAVAVGSISVNSTVLSAWTIDQEKTITTQVEGY